MVRIVELDPVSAVRIERFLADARGRRVSLTRVRLVTGWLAAAVAATAGASGVTLGGAIFLSREAEERLASQPADALAALGELLVHECVHVVQYREAGTSRFLATYLKDYFTSLIEQSSCRRVARLRAYLGIRAEREAFALTALWASSTVPGSAGLFPDPLDPSCSEPPSDKV